jgi:hypothetical protein
MSKTIAKGRFCRQIIINLAVSIIAEKFNLFVDYCFYNEIKNLGINLFIGDNKYDNAIELTDNNYFGILEGEKLYTNIDPNNNTFQTKNISNMIYNYLQNELIKQNIINANVFRGRYKKNNDIFVHIRLTDVADLNPGYYYYRKAIQTIINSDIYNKNPYNNIYICSDDFEHYITKNIAVLFPNTTLLDLKPQYIIQFGSTCKNIVLSHGCFSAFIGYLGYDSTIYYPEYDENNMWHGDIFSINGWNMVKEYKKI